ncbi:sodium:proline symporter [Clostridia bacterium]|nr:sodium:proline symporter [Clostridia bacterium]
MLGIIIFIVILVASFILAVASKKGAIASNMNDVMTASGSFGGFLVFFVSVGEIYALGTLIGAPGAIFAQGANYGVWFIGYVLLAYVVGYFLNPASWRLGQLSKAMTLADNIGWRYNSKVLEVIVACVGIGFLTPWIQNQFAGMAILFNYLNIGINFYGAVVISSILAFVYILIAGIRAPAWVSILKDILLVAAIIIIGIAAAIHHNGGVTGIFQTVQSTHPESLFVQPGKPVGFTISTIIFQMCGFYMLPITFQAVLTSRNEKILRENTIFMPLYMLMFPFLVITAYFAVATIPDLPNKDFATLAVAVDTLPNWMMGFIAGGGAITAILVMAMTALCVGGLFSKNIIGVIRPKTKEKTLVVLVRVVTAIFLCFGMITAIYFPNIMANVITIAYGGLSQTFAGVLLGFFWKKTNKWSVGAGILCGVATYAILVNMFPNPLGLNSGFWALAANFIVTIILSLIIKPDALTVKRFEAFQLARPNRKIS